MIFLCTIRHTNSKSGAKVIKKNELCKRMRAKLTFWQKKMRGMHFVLAYMNFFLYFCTAFYAELKKLNTDN